MILIPPVLPAPLSPSTRNVMRLNASGRFEGAVCCSVARPSYDLLSVCALVHVAENMINCLHIVNPRINQGAFGIFAYLVESYIMFCWVGTQRCQLLSMTCIYWHIYFRELYRQSFWTLESVQSVRARAKASRSGLGASDTQLEDIVLKIASPLIVAVSFVAERIGYRPSL